MPQIKTHRTFVDGSTARREILEELNRAAGSDARVLISGDLEVGKEVFARRIHRQGARRRGPFVATTCAGVETDLLKSLRRANRGTLFIDEICDLDSLQQDALLTFLESSAADVRIIAASGRNVYDEVVAGRFNETLFYRLNVIHIVVSEHAGHDEDAWKSIEETATVV